MRYSLVSYLQGVSPKRFVLVLLNVWARPEKSCKIQVIAAPSFSSLRTISTLFSIWVDFRLSVFVISCYLLQRLVNNYWTSLSKIWQWRADQLHNWSAIQWQITIFAIPEFNNCSIIRSPSSFSYFNHSGCSGMWSAVFHTRTCLQWLRISSTFFCNKTHWYGIAQEQTIICGQLFVGQMVCCRLTRTKGIMNQMIVLL